MRAVTLIPVPPTTLERTPDRAPTRDDRGPRRTGPTRPRLGRRGRVRARPRARGVARAPRAGRPLVRRTRRRHDPRIRVRAVARDSRPARRPAPPGPGEPPPLEAAARRRLAELSGRPRRDQRVGEGL